MMSQTQSVEKIAASYKNFLYITSHDLSAPVRHLEFFISSLAQSIDDDLTQDNRECLGFINSALFRLKKMQQALLNLSRVLTCEEKIEKISITKIIDETIFSMKEISDVHITIDIHDHLSSIVVVPNQIRQVLRILIENAILYQEEGGTPRLHITAKRDGHNSIIQISDNGIGVGEPHRTRIFDMFRRLHAENEYGGGVGAGLTIAREIIEKHDGHIWCDSNEGGGSRFSFSLPCI